MKKIILLLILLSGACFSQTTNSARMLSAPNQVQSASYAFVQADSTRLTTFASAGAVAAALAAGLTATINQTSIFSVQNLGPGTVTITCTGCLIFSNNSTGSATYSLSAGQGADLYTAGLNYIAQSGAGAGTGVVTSFNTRTGAVTPQTGDYTCAQVTNCAGGGVSGKWPGNWIGANAAAVIGNTFNGGANVGMALQASNSSAAVGTVPTSTQGKFVAESSASSTTSGGISEQELNVTVGILQDWFAKVSTVGLTSSRYWYGLTDTLGSSSNTTFNSNTPAANFIGFRYSSSVDTTLKAVCQTSSSNQTVVSTPIAPTPSTPQTLEIVPGSGVVNFYINGTLEATCGTNIPSSSTPLGSILTVDDIGNVGLSNMTFNFYYLYALLIP